MSTTETRTPATDAADFARDIARLLDARDALRNGDVLENAEDMRDAFREVVMQGIATADPDELLTMCGERDGEDVADDIERWFTEDPLEIVVMRQVDGAGEIDPDGARTVEVLLSMGGPTVHLNVDRHDVVTYHTTAHGGGSAHFRTPRELDAVVAYLAIAAGIEIDG